jgi:type I restriction enzyme S subunit
MSRKQSTVKAPKVNPNYGQFDHKIDAVEAKKTPSAKKGASVEAWAVPLQDIYDNDALRLDATHYDRETALAVRDLKKAKYPLKHLSELADVLLPGQFVRIWAKDPAYGYPYVNASELMSLAATGGLGGKERYLSRETETDIDELIIREGTLLMSCSGTIGRLFYVSKRLDGWAATHDLIRIVPKKGVHMGYLHAYLSSSVAQKQILGHTHGGQIDHVTHHQVGGVLVPMLPEDTMRDMHKQVMKALDMRERAIDTLAEVISEMENSVKHGR